MFAVTFAAGTGKNSSAIRTRVPGVGVGGPSTMLAVNAQDKAVSITHWAQPACGTATQLLEAWGVLWTECH